MTGEILKTLNLAEDASEEIAIKAIEELKMKAKKGEEMEKLFKEDKEKRVKSIVEQAVKDKRITADKKEVFEKIGLTNGIDTLEACLDSTKEVKIPDVSKAIRDKEKGGNEDITLNAETWDKMDKEGTLLELKEKDKDTYIKLFNCKFKKNK
jgi:hypothetical protein